jgi:hypothetical protein
MMRACHGEQLDERLSAIGTDDLPELRRFSAMLEYCDAVCASLTLEHSSSGARARQRRSK